jgi:hypothetical protein
MKNLPQLLKSLERLGFQIKISEGTKRKLYPPDKNMPFYSLHVGEKSLHPLRRFAAKNWNLDLESL